MHPSASQTRPMRSSTPASCARRERRLARLAEEDDAEELDHDVGGERGGERDERGAERQQHVDEGVRHFVRKQERLQQQPLGDEAVERRQPRHRERADQREPRDPGHAMDQAAEAPEVALAGRVQHRARAEKQQALHERVIEAVIQQRRAERAPRASGMPTPWNTSARPRAVKMMPMFSIDE